MTKYLWEKLKTMFPTFADGVTDYKDAGKHAIKCRCKDGSVIDFTYDGPKDITLKVSRTRRQK